MLKVTKRGCVGSHGFVQMEDKLRSKHLRAQQYYDELLMETLERKKILHRAKRARRTLEAEVRFLRQRYEYLMSIRSPTPPPKQDVPRIQVRQPHKQALPMERIYKDRDALPTQRAYIDREALPSKRAYIDKEALPSQRGYIDREAEPSERVYSDREALPVERISSDREAAALPNRARVIDLNQISTEEEENEILTIVELSRAEKNLMKSQTSRGGKPPLPPRRSNMQLSGDVKFSVCRDVGKGSSHTGKRKISWQDPVALRV